MYPFCDLHQTNQIQSHIQHQDVVIYDVRGHLSHYWLRTALLLHICTGVWQEYHLINGAMLPFTFPTKSLSKYCILAVKLIFYS